MHTPNTHTHTHSHTHARTHARTHIVIQNSEPPKNGQAYIRYKKQIQSTLLGSDRSRRVINVEIPIVILCIRLLGQCPQSYFLVGSDFCRLLIIFASSLDPDHDQRTSSLRSNTQLLTHSQRSMGLVARKSVIGGFANNKGADKPAHPRSLISVFVVHLLESIISRLATSEISFF